MRLKREHGRILSVETKTRGSALAADYAAGVTTISVDDAGDFDEDGGWLYVGAQTVEYLSCDDDAGTIVLADPLAEAGEQGDAVALWSDLYAEVVDFQEALVELDGEYDNPDPVIAEVAEGVGDLPEGDRGKAGESCTLLRVADDEWEVVGVGGRPRSAATTSGGLFWQDSHTVAEPGSQAVALTHLPIDNSEHVYWHPGGGAGIYQQGSEWTRVGQAITFPDAEGILAADDLLTVEYAYRKGVTTTAASAGAPYDPTLCANVRPTTCSAEIYVYNAANWESRITIGGTWDGGGPLTNMPCRIVYRDAADPDGTIKFTPELQLNSGTIDTQMVGGLYGGDRTGCHVYGVQLYGTSADWSALTPQNGGTLGTTDPSSCRFWWGEQIAVTTDRSDEPMGDVNGNLAAWWTA